MKNKLEKELNKRDKRFDFRGLFKNFVTGAQEDVSEEEVILNDASLTKQEKEELLAGMKNTESLAHNLFAENIKKAARKTTANPNLNKANSPKVNSVKARKQNEYGERVD